MIEPLSHVAACRSCGAPFDPSMQTPVRFCPFCGADQQNVWPQPDAQAYPPPADQFPFQAVSPAAPPALDPDRPRWGLWTGIGAWLFSVAALLITANVVAVILYLYDVRRGVLPMTPDREMLEAWQQSPHVAVPLVYSTIFAHLVTILLCWVVVTRLRKQPFLESLGWNWAGRSPWLWLLIAVGIFIAITAINQILTHILPQKDHETLFDKLLQSGLQARIAVALLACLSAPLVEEIVYRGVLFSGLRKRFSAAVTVMAVTLLFAGVHFPQYWGDWAPLGGLTVLSLALTFVRARSKSLLPCIVIHFLNNAVASISILFYKGS